ncbi:MAG: hypothetical protein GF320_04965 [Armatimonadia bacterium]|nr:hypothetical protein [Armatimonadia bacterium]
MWALALLVAASVVAPWKDDPGVILLHRQAGMAAPENTVPALEAAVGQGADGVEIDVRRTADGVFVLYHDDWLLQELGAGGRIEELTLAQALELDIGSRWGDQWAGLSVPLLVDVLSFCRANDLLIHLDIKTPGTYDQIMGLVDDEGCRDLVQVAGGHAPDDAHGVEVPWLGWNYLEGGEEDPSVMAEVVANAPEGPWRCWADDARSLVMALGREPWARDFVPYVSTADQVLADLPVPDRPVRTVDDLADPDPNVRERACTALAEHPDPAALRQLVDLAASDPDHQVRLEACWALGALGDPSAVPVLSELALCSAEDAEMPELAEIIYLKVASACALVRIGGEDAEGTIQRLAHSGEDLDPALAGLALAAYGGADVVPQIVALLSDAESGADVAGFVVPHLGRFGVSAAPAYLSALDIEGWPSRHCVFWLAQIGDEAIPEVEAFILDDTRSNASRRRAALALYWMSTPQAATTRDRLSRDGTPAPEVRDALVLPRPWAHDHDTEGD